MKAKILFCLFVIVLQSCYSSFDQEVEYRIDPLLKPFVDKFYKEGLQRGVTLKKSNLIVSLDDRAIDPNNLGESRIIGGQRMVLINRKFYKKFIAEGDTIYVERLMMHELGHALLNREHNSIFSVMNSGSYYSEYKNDSLRIILINELFSSKPHIKL